ncbi:MAG: hypothetical protein HWQ23_19285 [Nostoc sp. JL33]|nr:hypothetical protein [Nostoc sp. JL33]MBN3872348.1 hypothetical protein [Nostoc sp. JL33]
MSVRSNSIAVTNFLQNTALTFPNGLWRGSNTKAIALMFEPKRSAYI